MTEMPGKQFSTFNSVPTADAGVPVAPSAQAAAAAAEAPAPAAAQAPARAESPRPEKPRAKAPEMDDEALECARQPIGVVLDIAGSGSQIALDLERLNECMDSPDPSIALAGQVGSQIKIRTKDGWLLANVRDQKQDRRGAGNSIAAHIDFMGEGMEEKLTGKIHGFRRGVTRYPIPGALVYPATTEDLRQIYASDGRSAIQIGTVYPTNDIRAGMYIDAMLGKHFALLGSALFFIGLTVHIMMLIRAGADPEPLINQTDPERFDT